MISSVAIIDYQMSNLFSVQHACEFLGLRPQITSDPAAILKADAAILPGVGAFGDAMANLSKLGLTDAIHEFIKTGKPFMGVCLGLQLLFTESDEFGQHQGLNIVQGQVTKFPPKRSDGSLLKVPQIAWNTIHAPAELPGRWSGTPLRSTAEGEYMYFVHSFYVKPDEPKTILTTTSYEGFPYCSAVAKDNVFAAQFHPEKSGPAGIRIYQEWAALASS